MERVKKFVKKAIPAEAIQYTSENIFTVLDFCKGKIDFVPEKNTYRLETLEEPHDLKFGEWIIKGIDGEFYPCQDDIFRKSYISQENIGELSDGYHTFNALYEQRAIIFAVLCSIFINTSWKSRQHFDGSMYEGYFIAGIATPEGQYTFHIEDKYWTIFNIHERKHAPKWDGHRPEDVDRLLSLIPKLNEA